MTEAMTDNGRESLVIIPARLAATRLPDKPLATIAGAPMIVHVWRRAVEADVGPVIVACADRAIAEAVEAAGGEAVMTDPALPSGSDRVHAAAASRDPEGRFDIVVNLQGDLPAIDPALIRASLVPLRDPAVDIATLVVPTADPAERDNPNVVKAVMSLAEGAAAGRALYFTRAAAPSGAGPVWHHIGIYAWRRPALDRFVGLPPSPLEKREKLEQLRALEAGMRIDAAVADGVPFGVDTPEDLARARAMLEQDA
ncbi:MAG: 3-deoxy-manno-octulosonate cytidylyltransferase [Rhodospirillaceae bacterium]|nr:3-deoxy-manno-octulosonate cytidylyltransferase [Rhodospirillaceae bacterium]MDE0616614.1 3-deoxy-manno-octulosonate cytidylyltransferase [Rhodospirillaceae bacterium]